MHPAALPIQCQIGFCKRFKHINKEECCRKTGNSSRLKSCLLWNEMTTNEQLDAGVLYRVSFQDYPQHVQLASGDLEKYKEICEGFNK